LGLQEKIYNGSPVFIQNLMVSAYGYTWMKRRFGGVFKAELEKARQREHFTTAQWQNYQAAALQRLLQHAYSSVPYYRDTFTAAGLNSQSIKNILPGSLSALPVLTKEQLRQHGASTLLSSIREKGGSFFSSSGSTGTPTQIIYSHAMHQRWFGIYELRVRNWAGVSSFTPRGMIGGRRILPEAQAKPPYYRYNYFEKQAYFSAYHISPKTIENYKHGMLQHHVQYMTGYAVSNFILARFFKELNIEAPQLKCVITSSEKLTQEMRDVFSSVYGCKTYDGWGSVEACGLITECEHGNMHISPDAGILEVLDDNLNPVAPGVEGTVYCTGLLNYDQPLIRYRIGDTMILSDETCPCGRAMPVVKEIAGRVEDVITGTDGRQMVRFHSIFNGLHAIKLSQVIQESATDIVVKLVTAEPLNEEGINTIKKRIRSQLGDMNVMVEEVDNIPLSKNGKFRAVVSKLKNNAQL
jgi:phenylacetate-CoA ligase